MYDINNDEQYNQTLMKIYSEMDCDMAGVALDDRSIPPNSAVQIIQIMMTKVYMLRYEQPDGNHDEAVCAARTCAEFVLDAMNNNAVAAGLPPMEYEIGIHKTGHRRTSPISGNLEKKIVFRVDLKLPTASWEKVN